MRACFPLKAGVRYESIGVSTGPPTYHAWICTIHDNSYTRYFSKNTQRPRAEAVRHGAFGTAAQAQAKRAGVRCRSLVPAHRRAWWRSSQVVDSIFAIPPSHTARCWTGGKGQAPPSPRLRLAARFHRSRVSASGKRFVHTGGSNSCTGA